mgnify:CR=1 FL=1
MLAEILAGLEHRYPVENADSWDAPGLVVGSTQQQVGHVRLSVDVTSAVVAEAVSDGVDLLVAHHPLLLRGVTSIAEESLNTRPVPGLAASAASDERYAIAVAPLAEGFFWHEPDAGVAIQFVSVRVRARGPIPACAAGTRSAPGMIR